MRLHNSQRRPFILFLTLWFTLVSGGVSLTHAHALSQSPCQKNHPPLTPSPAQQGHLHRHLVIFGIESPLELPPDSSSDLPGGHVECVSLIDVKCDKGCLSDCLNQLAVDRTSFTDEIALQKSFTPPVELFAPIPLSTFALHNSSGVLRF